jgi:hypothetical protein
MDQNAKLIGSITRIRLNKLVKLGALCAICSVAFVFYVRKRRDNLPEGRDDGVAHITTGQRA